MVICKLFHLYYEKIFSLIVNSLIVLVISCKKNEPEPSNKSSEIKNKDAICNPVKVIENFYNESGFTATYKNIVYNQYGVKSYNYNSNYLGKNSNINFYYNSYGNITKVSEYYNGINSFIDYDFHYENNLITYFKASNNNYSYRYTYSSDGNMINRVKYNLNSKDSSVYFNYNSGGRPSLEKVYVVSTSGVFLKDSILYYYNEDNNCIQISNYYKYPSENIFYRREQKCSISNIPDRKYPFLKEFYRIREVYFDISNLEIDPNVKTKNCDKFYLTKISTYHFGKDGSTLSWGETNGTYKLSGNCLTSRNPLINNSVVDTLGTFFYY